MPWSRDPGRYRGVPTAVADRIRHRDGRTCQQCGQPGWQVDHVVNVAAGGTDDEGNLQVLCDDCHTTKTSRESAAGRAKVSRWREPEQHPGRVVR